MINQKNGYMLAKKSELKRISISDVSAELPELKNIFETKSAVIAKWLAKWIETNLKSGKIQENDILPSKSDFAYFLGVSIGTMQYVYRQIEDWGYVQSKQCIGTLVRDNTKQKVSVRKLTSKRDLAAEAIKRYILSDGFSAGSQLPTSRTIATIIGFSANTTRMALEYLASKKILLHRYRNSNGQGWIVLTTDIDINPDLYKQKTETLVDMVVKDLEEYITNNLGIGDKMPPHLTLAKNLKASIKTIHDALKVLVERGILLPRRGRYGTSVIKLPNSDMSVMKPEKSIFAPAKDTAFYHYEKTQNAIKRMIAKDYEIGDKLPSVQELSKSMDLSPNTIRKAFHNLEKEGYLVFSRGRYGGTFVIDIPEIDSNSFKWLSVNPEYAKEHDGVNMG